MLLAKFFLVFIVLIERMCFSRVTIKIKKSEGFTEIEEAAIQVLTTCYENEDKTIVLLGDYPNNFIKNLSAHRSFSLILLDSRRRAENNNNDWNNIDVYRLHKVHIVLIITSRYLRLVDLLGVYQKSIYNNPQALVLLIGWSAEKIDAPCDWKKEIVYLLATNYANSLFNTNLICRDRKFGILIYGFNPFVNHASKPWNSVKIKYRMRRQDFFTFVQKYQKNDEQCKFLNIEKTNDLNGTAIELVWHKPVKSGNVSRDFLNNEKISKGDKYDLTITREIIEQKKRFNFFRMFIAYVNATKRDVVVKIVKGNNTITYIRGLQTRPHILRGITKSSMAYTYPTGVECKVLLTQSRGNESKLKKFLSVLDISSWIGIIIVFFITLIFFKYFLHQSMTVGILNLLRLICNFGLETLPLNLQSRIYLVFLLFFVLIIRQFIDGNLAAVLTQEIPARQVNSIQDLADLGYKVYVEEPDFIFFNDSIFEDRVILKLSDDDCIPYVLSDPLIACLTWGGATIDNAIKFNLHVSDDCVLTEYITNLLPWNWPLEEKLNYFLGLMIDAGTLVSLDGLVNEKRLDEATFTDSQSEPKIITFDDLSFAFIFLGIGTMCAFISFIFEIIIYRFRYRERTQSMIF